MRSVVHSFFSELQEQQSNQTKFCKLLHRQDERYTMEFQLKQLTNVVGDVYETKVLYTSMKHSVRQKLVDSSTGNSVLKECLATTAEICTSEDAFIVFMLVVEKAEADLIVGRNDFPV